MTTLFQEKTINGMTLPNRLVRSATWEGMCEPDGRPTQKLCAYMQALAQGGIGLVVSGYVFVRPDGKQLPGQMGIHSDDFGPDFQNLTQAVHDAGGKIAAQLVHTGGQTVATTAGCQPWAPSAIKLDQYPEMPAELGRSEIAALVDAFAQGALRAKTWGFDAVQLHGAHGYLINQFLSPLTNRRTDEYGGSVVNRCRFLMEIYRKVRRAVGDDFPVMIKLNGSDCLEGGLQLDDALYAARKLVAEGIDAIEVSAGTPASGKKGPARERINKPEKEAYNLSLARQIKGAVTCPVMVVGGLRSYAVAEQAVQNEGLDFVAMSRPLIREPNLPSRWKSGDQGPATCISCNGCFKPGMKEGGIYCVQEKKAQERAKRT